MKSFELIDFAQCDEMPPINYRSVVRFLVYEPHFITLCKINKLKLFNTCLL